MNSDKSPMLPRGGLQLLSYYDKRRYHIVVIGFLRQVLSLRICWDESDLYVCVWRACRHSQWKSLQYRYQFSKRHKKSLNQNGLSFCCDPAGILKPQSKYLVMNCLKKFYFGNSLFAHFKQIQWTSIRIKDTKNWLFKQNCDAKKWAIRK